MCPNTAEILTVARLSNFMITVKAIKFEKGTPNDVQNLFVDKFTTYNKYSVLNTEYLAHPIHMKLFQKQKRFSNFLHI